MKLRKTNPSSKAAAEETSSSIRIRQMISVLKAHDIIHGMTPEKLRLILEDLGPTFVKLGQIVSMRHDLLPQEYCDELVKLRADVRPISCKEVLAIIQEEYGMPFREVFAHIEREPLGSASIAQVHAATLTSGKRVVVKVQRPEIYETMAQDVALMKRTTRWLKRFGSMGEAIDLGMVIDEMWFVAQQEMNFLLEASHNHEFSRLNADIQYVICPHVEDQLTTSRILVMEYIDGIQIDDLKLLKESGYDINEIGMKLAENYVKQIVDDAFFHADPHPGNIRIRGGKIVWLDLGMIGRLSERDRVLLRNAVIAVVSEDIYELKSIVLSLGAIKGQINHTRLYTDIDNMITKYGTLDLANINVGKLIQDLVKLAKHHGISMPSGVTMLGRGIMTIEGVLAACCPQVNFIQIMANHLSGEEFGQFDIGKEIKLAGKLLYSSSKKSLDLPSQLSDFLKIMTKGQSKMNMELVGSEEPLKQIDKMIDKLVVCMITAALLIGSSLLCMTDMKPKILGIPFLGLFFFINALFPGGWLLYKVIFKKKG